MTTMAGLASGRIARRESPLDLAIPDLDPQSEEPFKDKLCG
jgi:hypothetical protein